jgi:hypothetical protein
MSRCERLSRVRDAEASYQTLARGLVFAYSQRHGAPFDEVTGATGVPTSATSGADLNVVGTQFTGGADLASVINFGQFDGTADLNESPATWAFYCSWNAGANRFSPACHEDNNVAHGWQVGQDLFSGNAGAGLTLIRSVNDMRALTSMVNVPIGVPFTFVVTHDGSSTSANCNIYIDAVLQAHGVAAQNGNGTTGGPATAESLYLGRGRIPSPGGSHSGSIYVALIANRQWSLAEVEAFDKNPMAAISRPRMLPWFPL